MKLISLNIWAGIVYEPLIKFITEKANEVDVFCFQEVMFGSEPEFTPIQKFRVNIFSELKNILKKFVPFTHYSTGTHFIKEPLSFLAGQAIFVRNSIKVNNNGGFLCYDEKGPVGAEPFGKISGNCQWVDLENEMTIANLHGLWQEGTDKEDTPERIKQSLVLKEFLDKKTGKKILCGDFNLFPNTKSLAILEEGMRSLIKEYGIQSTRSHLYLKEGKFADYILASREVDVKDFYVIQNAVSDHLPLFMEFN